MEFILSDDAKIYNQQDKSRISCSRMSPEKVQFLNTKKNRAFENPIDEFQYYLLDDKLQQSEESEDENAIKSDDELPFDSLSKKYDDLKVNEQQNKKNNDRFLKHKKQVTRAEEKMHELRTSVTKFHTLPLLTRIKFYLSLAIQPSKYVFSPDGYFRVFWDILVMLMILYELITIPFEISFSQEVSSDFEICIDVLFIFDIFLNFNTGYYRNGIVVRDHELIFYSYIRGWFWIDLIGSIPYTRLIEYEVEKSASSDYSNESLIKSRQYLKYINNIISRLISFTKLIRIVRITRLVKLNQIIEKIEQLIQLSTTFAAIFSFVELSILVLYFMINMMRFWSHWLGCAFFFIAKQEKLENHDTWFDKVKILNPTLFEEYITSLYWAVVTMNTVGYGDISPQTQYERSTGIFFLLMACGVFSFIMNKIGSALQSVSEKREEVNRQSLNIHNWCQANHISKSLQKRINAYLRYLWDKQEQTNLEDITKTLSSSLRQQLVYQVNGSILVLNPVFVSHFSRPFLIKICHIMKEKTIFPDEQVFSEQDDCQDRSLYFLIQGNAQLFLQRNDQLLQTFTKGDSFGIISFFTGQKRKASVRSLNFSDYFYLEREDFLGQLKNHQLDLEWFMEVRHRIIFHSELHPLGINCFSCKSDNHVIVDCPSLHFTVNLYMLIKVKKKCERLISGQYVRKDLIAYNALIDNHIIMEAAKRFQMKLGNFLDDLNQWNAEYENRDEIIDDYNYEKYQYGKRRLLTIGLVTNPFKEEVFKKKLITKQLKIQKNRLYCIEQNEKNTRRLQKKLKDIIPGSPQVQKLLHFTTREFKRERKAIKQQEKMLNLVIHISKPHSRSHNQNFHKSVSNQGDIGLEIIQEVSYQEEYGLQSDQNIIDSYASDTDSNSSGPDHMAEYKLIKTLRKYASQKKYLYRLNNQNKPHIGLKLYDTIENFDCVQQFTLYNPVNNIEQVVQDYSKIFSEGQQLMGDQYSDCDTAVYEELIESYQLAWEERRLVDGLPDNRVRKNLSNHQTILSKMGRQKKKSLNLFRSPCYNHVMTTVKVFRAMNSVHKTINFHD